ncbi:DUF791-domain-containing protein [Obba rivulosa]|uniref:Molybdate-anion transporter n=1 Tax=Obba rivulosa TaxID=1052685 RepID=A0A8E2ATL3_9APHY|nr:DUF791-domain-containing protein [Obba rivulosa]
MARYTFYEGQLLILIGFCVLFLLAGLRSSKAKGPRTQAAEDESATPASTHATQDAMSKLTRQYLIVYAVVMGADWLQGPYVYSLYKEEYAFPERLVAIFFVTGFLSAGLAAPVVGVWADQHGRKKLCLVFCITYALACACILFPSLPILFLGRLLGGISTSILYSAFETWLISSANSLALPPSDLSTILGRATLVNAVVATAAGVVSNELVETTGTFTSPFIASGIILMLGWVVITGSWTENYGRGGGSSVIGTDVFQLKRLGQAWKTVSSDLRLLVLGLTQTCFEGSMYLFVFLWVPFLQEAAVEDATLPLGYIFSSFMVSMMIGSIFYNAITAYHLPSGTSSGDPGESTLTLHAKLSSLICAASALSFAISIYSENEHVRFWAFCVFEACVGMYYPVQGMLRGTLISDEHRATISSLFRVPLNVFVVVSLLTGVSSARHMVLAASALMLLFSSIMTGLVLVNPFKESSPSHPRPA